MKIDRLYGITVYLMNHGKTPAAKLAKKFEVSIRTISGILTPCAPQASLYLQNPALREATLFQTHSV